MFDDHGVVEEVVGETYLVVSLHAGFICKFVLLSKCVTLICS